MAQDILQTLEFHEIQIKLAAKATSLLAKEKALQWSPVYDAFLVQERLDETEEAWKCLTEEASAPLGETHDIRKTAEKAQKDICLLTEEFMEMAATLETYLRISRYFSGDRHLRYPLLEEKAALLSNEERLVREIRRVFDEHGNVNDGASPTLSRIRGEKNILKSRIRRVFQRIISDKSQADFLRDSIITQRNGRFVVPVKEEYRYKFNGIIYDRSSTGQTLFMEPMISVELNNDLADAEAQEKQEIEEIFNGLTQLVKERSRELIQNCEIVTELELIFARGALAVDMNGIRADFSSEESVLHLHRAIHPLLNRETAIPVSFSLGKSFQILIISGSNAGGKTIAMKTAGLLALMNQSGLFIPAEEGSALPVYKHIYAVIGDEQSIAYNLSTFSGYIMQLQTFLKQTGDGDLVLLDELGSGTDPVEGAALAQAVTEYLQMRGVSAVITSHFDEMKKLAYESKGIENAFVEFNEETLTPTYRLLVGSAGNSNALRICRRLNVYEGIVSRAEKLVKSSPLHHMKEITDMLNLRLREAEREQADAENMYEKAKRLQEDLKRELSAFQDKRTSVLEKMRADAENMKRDLRNQAESIIKDMKKKQLAIREKQELNEYASSVREQVREIYVPETEKTLLPLQKGDIFVGMIVYIDSLGCNGTVLSVKGSKVMAQCEGMTVTVPISKCYRAKQNTEKPKEERKRQAPRRESDIRSVPSTLHIIGKTVNESIPDIDSFLNDALLGGLSAVQIIHGKGTGNLRKGVHAYLRTLPFVKEFREADIRNGGAGATDVFFN